MRYGLSLLTICSCLLLTHCDSQDDSGEPTRLETFFPNVLNNIIQDPDDASRDNVYPEFTLNLEEATPADRDGVIAVAAFWPDGRTTSLEKDFRPEDGILRWVKHDLDRFGTRAPSGDYRFRVELNTGEVVEPVETFDQHLLGRPTNISIRRTAADLSVSWTGPDRTHLWSVEIQSGDPGSSQVTVPGPGVREAGPSEHVSVAFEDPALLDGTTYRLAIIMSDDSNLRSLETPFVW